jgi:hypothetical protein
LSKIGRHNEIDISFREVKKEERFNTQLKREGADRIKKGGAKKDLAPLKNT